MEKKHQKTSCLILQQCTLSLTHTHSYTHKHTYTLTHTHSHIHKHTHTHTHTHTHSPPTHLYPVFQGCVRVELVEELIGGKVKSRNDLLRVSDQLGVELSTEARQVIAVDVEEWLLEGVDLDGRGRGKGEE